MISRTLMRYGMALKQTSSRRSQTTPDLGLSKKSTPKETLLISYTCRMREITQDVAFSLIFDEECNKPPVDLVSLKTEDRGSDDNDDTEIVLQVAPNQETRDAWVAAISHFITILKSLSSQKEFEM